MTPPLVSVIVPTFNSAEFLEECLRSIQQQSYKPIELIVVDNNSQDNTRDIARRYTNHVYNRGPERCAQRNYGVKKSTGEYLLIIDSDMVLTPQVIEGCICKKTQNPHYKALVIPEESFGTGFWTQCKILERSLYIGLPWMEASRFFCRKTYEVLGGYNEDLICGDDYDLAQRIEERYTVNAIGRLENQGILHNEGQLNLSNICKKKFYYGKTFGHYKSNSANNAKSKKQASLITRYALFFSKPKKLFKNPLNGMGMLLLKACEFAAGGLGYLSVLVQNFGDKMLRK
jgi:glycosyltransferase involved in cell wall biosynthesis